MSNKIECAFCNADLKDGSGISKSFWYGVTLPEKKEFVCRNCHTMSRIVEDSTVRGIRDFMAQYIFSYYHQSERLNGKTLESTVAKAMSDAEDAKV